MTRSLLVVSLLAALLGAAGCDHKKPAPPAAGTGPVAPIVAKTPAPSGPPAVTGAGGTRFAKKAPAVGDRAESSVGMHMVLQMTIDPTGSGTPQKASMETSETETRREEVLAVAGEAVTKLKVTFVEKLAVMKENGKERKRPSPVTGKTYVIEAKDGKLTVLLDGDRPAPVAQARVVKEAYETLGKVDTLYAAVPTRPLKPGDLVPELSAAMKEEMRVKAKEMDVSSVKVVFKEVRGDVGVFEIELMLSKVEKPMKFEMKLKGQATMSLKTGQPVALKLEGPVSVGSTEGAGGKMKIEGTGTMQLTLDRKRP